MGRMSTPCGPCGNQTQLFNTENSQQEKDDGYQPENGAVVAGLFFLLTEITAIGAVFLYGAVVSDPNHIVRWRDSRVAAPHGHIIAPG
ncbi:MAG: hypothetical protein ABI670_06880 [Chloroflexota bacterium]